MNHNLARSGTAPYGAYWGARGSPQAQHGPTTAGWRWDGGSGFSSF